MLGPLGTAGNQGVAYRPVPRTVMNMEQAHELQATPTSETSGAHRANETPSPFSATVLIVALLGTLAWPASRSYAITLLVLLTLVGLHEAGHFLVARRLKVSAPEFAIGFGPVLWSRHWHGTRYSLRAVPLGGFVRIDGMDGGPVEGRIANEGTRGMDKLSPGGKAAVAAAGPLTNIAIAVLLILVICTAVGVSKSTTTIARVDRAAPAYAAGIQSGDRVVQVGETPVDSWEDLLGAISTSKPGVPVPVTVVRDNKIQTLTITPESQGGQTRFGVTATAVRERIGLPAALTTTTKVSARLFSDSVRGLASFGSAVASMPAQFVSRDADPSARIVSPVGAAKIADTAADRAGIGGVLLLIAAVSMFLAVFNLLPVPPFDGGHIALAAYEAAASAIVRRPVTVDRRHLIPVALTVTVLVGLVGLAAIALDLVRPVVLP